MPQNPETFRKVEDAIKWVENNVPFAVRTVSKKAKTQLVSPFNSNHAFKTVTEHLGQELFKLLQTIEQTEGEKGKLIKWGYDRESNTTWYYEWGESAQEPSKQRSAEEILRDLAMENGLDTWNQFICCFHTTEPGRRVIDKNILRAMEEYSEQNCDHIRKLFMRPAEKLKPLQDLYREEHPDPDGRYYIPDATKFYEWITEKVLEMYGKMKQ